MRFRLAPTSVTLDALERRKRLPRRSEQKFRRPLKNFNEDRPISLVGKCRPMHLFAINIKCMRICVGFPSEKVHLPPIPASIYSLTHFLAYFPTTILSQRPGTSVLCRAAGGWPDARPPSLAGCCYETLLVDESDE